MAGNMTEDQQIDAENPQLPEELIDWLTEPFKRFLRMEAAVGSILLLFTIAALVLTNLSVDDIGSILVVAIGYSNYINWELLFFGGGWHRRRARNGFARYPEHCDLFPGRWVDFDHSKCVRDPSDGYGRNPRLDDADRQLGERQAVARHLG